MYQSCICVVDASRARIFRYEREALPEGLREDLVEIEDLINPSRRLSGSELFADDAPSSRVGSRAYGIDDHRDSHVRRFDAQFAKQIVGRISAILQRTGARRLVVCAKPNMMGELRAAWDALGVRDHIEIDELPRDLVKLTPTRLREQLTAHGMLPAPVVNEAARVAQARR